MGQILMKNVVCVAVYLLASFASSISLAQNDIGWSVYGSDLHGQRYSSAHQITARNVRALKPVWEYHTNALSQKRVGSLAAAFEATPVLFKGRLYLTTPFDEVIALDAVTGKKQWSYVPSVNVKWEGNLVTSRGVAIWEGPKEGSDKVCKDRVLVGTLDATVIELDAASGALCTDFGSNGQVDLSKDVQHLPEQTYEITSPPTVVGNIVVVGSSIPDNYSVDVERGTVRALDVRTGKILWSWEPIPWATSQTVRTGAANAWSVIAADPELGLVYIPTGSPSPDYYGGMRLGDNRDADSVVALEASTGKKVWAFQVVHHNVWDYDVASEPLLFTFRKLTPAIAVTTKMGMVYVLDRRTGVPLWPVEERPVPQTDVPGEHTWPTQPFSSLPALGPTILREGIDDAWKRSPEDAAHCRKEISGLRNDGMFTPPSLRGSVEFPGPIGGVNWGSPAFNPASGVLYAANNHYAYQVRLIPRKSATFRNLKSVQWWCQILQGYPRLEMAIVSLLVIVFCTQPKVRRPFEWFAVALVASMGFIAMWAIAGNLSSAPEELQRIAHEGMGMDQSPQNKTPYALDRQPLLDLSGNPCTQLPWSALTALNLDTGQKLWDKPLGTLVEGQHTGTVELGGPIVTAGKLVFVAGTRDGFLRAFDAKSGGELWKGALPAPAQSTPMTYEMNKRQYVVIAAGGHGMFGTKPGDSVVAFALP
jgi:quinoprotein glucose dehydrogenase